MICASVGGKVSGSGDGQLAEPKQLALDAVGNVYVADQGNNRIAVFSPTGAFITNWGTLGTGPGQFNLPGGVAVDNAGNIYVGDDKNHRVQKFGPIPTSVTSTSWGRIKTRYR